MLGCLRFVAGLVGGLAGPLVGWELMARFFIVDEMSQILATMVFLLGCVVAGVVASQFLLFFLIWTGERLFRSR